MTSDGNDISDMLDMSAERLTAMQCLPDSLVGREYYHPTEEGLEGRFKTRLETIKAWKKEHGGK